MLNQILLQFTHKSNAQHEPMLQSSLQKGSFNRQKWHAAEGIIQYARQARDRLVSQIFPDKNPSHDSGSRRQVSRRAGVTLNFLHREKSVLQCGLWSKFFDHLLLLLFTILAVNMSSRHTAHSNVAVSTGIHSQSSKAEQQQSNLSVRSQQCL